MPLYEVLLEDWNEIRLSSEPLHVGNVVEIENTDWFVFGVAKTPEHSLRYLCNRASRERMRAERLRRDASNRPS